MNPLNQVNIEELSTMYNIKMSYHSDRKCENYDAKIKGIEESDGSVTIRKRDGEWPDGFVFDHSDPDRVIAIAQMMIGFASMVKNHNEQKGVDANISV